MASGKRILVAALVAIVVVGAIACGLSCWWLSKKSGDDERTLVAVPVPAGYVALGRQWMDGGGCRQWVAAGGAEDNAAAVELPYNADGTSEFDAFWLPGDADRGPWLRLVEHGNTGGVGEYVIDLRSPGLSVICRGDGQKLFLVRGDSCAGAETDAGNWRPFGEVLETPKAYPGKNLGRIYAGRFMEAGQ